jgi:RimJ/RimL family protein N-acetyltransferase
VLLGGFGEADALTSERLLLRPPRRGDLDALDAAITESLPDLVRWLPWAHHGHSRSDSRRYLRVAQSARGARNSFEFVITDSGDETLLGMASLHRLDWPRHSCGLGYWVRRSAWGKGYASEAAALLLGHAFVDLELNRVEALVALENAASHRVVEKLGFAREGVARGIERIDGAYLDHVQYALLASDVGERG